MSSEVVIRVQGLSKHYQVYETPRDRLKQFMLPRLQGLTRRPQQQYFHEFKALDNVSFEVRRGETVGIIGRNGSGKSTLLQVLCGTLAPTSGSVETHGRIAALLELGSGFNPEFTGRENVYLYASVLGLSRQTIAERFAGIEEFADIGEFINQPVKTYSSGMVVRLAFAVIAHVDADILVIDEALAVGDAFFVQKCMRFLRRFMENGTILFVSHDTSAVVNLCHHAIWLANGKVRYQGPSKEASERYLAALFETDTPADAEPAAATPAPPSPRPRGVVAAANAGAERDMRQDWINASSLRNDIEVFSFSPDAAQFGQRGASIASVLLRDDAGNRLNWVVGGEMVTLEVQCEAHVALNGPIVGFYLKDRLGQNLFGDNTYLLYADQPQHIQAGHPFQALFTFRMPTLPGGDYSIAVAIAEGTQQDHVQHHWIHDAVVLKSHSSSVSTGLIGIPITEIRLESL